MIRNVLGCDSVVGVPALHGQNLDDTRPSPTFAESKVTFGSDGAITWYSTLYGSQSVVSGWYAANVAAIGALFWIRFTINSGTGLTETLYPAAGTWGQLNVDRYIDLAHNSTSPGGGTYNLTAEIATDSGGTNIVSTCTFDMTAAST